MDDQSCPRCKTTRYRNRNLKLMVNVCGHALCENCVELLFVRGSGACPECEVPLRRSNFRLQLFEDSGVEKEVDIRKKILKDFNKKEDDFPSLREYNDYLEMVENVVFNLTNNIDLEETRRQIDQYKKDNQDAIKKNRSKLSKEDEYLEMLIEEEKAVHDHYSKAMVQEEQQAKRLKAKNKDALLDELMFSDLPADHIVASHQRDVAEEEIINKVKLPTTKFSSGIRIGGRQESIGIPVHVEGEIYSYAEPSMEWIGPDPPAILSLGDIGYLSHIRPTSDSEKGGGFDSSISCERALQEAFSGLYFSSLSLDSMTNKSRQMMEVT